MPISTARHVIILALFPGLRALPLFVSFPFIGYWCLLRIGCALVYITGIVWVGSLFPSKVVECKAVIMLSSRRCHVNLRLWL